MKYELIQTCGACPEQYDFFVDGRQIGYFRLRWGHFYVQYPDTGGETVYAAHPKGDGCFDNEEERSFFLEEGMAACMKTDAFRASL